MATILTHPAPLQCSEEHNNVLPLRPHLKPTNANKTKLRHSNGIYASLTTVVSQQSATSISLERFGTNNDIQVDSNTHLAHTLLQVCAQTKSLSGVRQVHALIIRKGFENVVSVVLKMAARNCKCGSVGESRLVFDRMPNRDLFSWTTMMGGYVSQGLFEKTVELLYEMLRAGMEPDNFVFPSVLKACAALDYLQLGLEIHGYVIRNGFDLDVVVANALIDIYGKCGRFEDARQVFDKMPQRDVISWNTMISCYMQNGHVDEARGLLVQMQVAGIRPDVISWNSIIGGCAQNSRDYEAMVFFCQMQLTSRKPNSGTIASVLTACSNLAALKQGKQVHCYIVRSGIGLDVFMGSALVDMYVNVIV